MFTFEDKIVLMKPFHRVVLAAVIFVSCQSNVSKDLDKIETVLWQKPDSALLYLQSIDTTKLVTKRNQAHYALLMSAAMDKNYIDVTSDELIQKAVNYYSVRNDSYHKMLAWYYDGIVLKNAGQFSASIVAFEKAENETLLLGDSFQHGLILRNKAEVFSSCLNDKEAIDCCKKAVLCFEKADAVNYQSYAELSLAIAYANDKKFESADSLLTSLLERYPEDQNLVSQCLARKAATLVNMDSNPETVIDYYRQIPPIYFSFLDYSYYAIAFEMLGAKDSSNRWIKEAYSKCKNREDTATVDYMKSGIALRRGSYKEAYHLVKNASDVQDSLCRALLYESVSSAQRDYYKAETLRQEEQLNNIRFQRFLAGIIGLLIILSAVLLFINYSRKKDKELQEQISRLAIKDKELTQKNKTAAHLLGSLLSARIENIDVLAQAYFNSDDQSEKEALFKQIKDNVASLRENPEIFVALENDLNNFCDGIMLKLRAQVPRIKGANLRIITLFFAGFSYDIVHLIMNSMSVNSLKMARSRFRKEITAAQAPDEAFFLKMLEIKQ